MKVIIFSVISLFISQSIYASSLEDLYSMQTVIKIEPVTYKGKFILARPDAVQAICGSLGYTRVVSEETEDCLLGEELYTISSSWSTSTAFGKYLKTCVDNGSPNKKIISVECAR